MVGLPIDVANVLTLGHASDSLGERVSAGMRHMAMDSNACVSDEERRAKDVVDEFSKDKGLDHEIIDLTKADLMTRLKFVIKGWKAPIVSVETTQLRGCQLENSLSRARRAHERLDKMAKATGLGSMDQKINLLAGLLSNACMH